MLAEKIKARLAELVEGVEDVREVSVKKNNGVVKHGFQAIYSGSNISPTCYYEDGEDEEVIIDRVVEAFAEERNATPSFDLSVFTDKEKMLKSVIPALVNAKKNENIGENIVTDDFLDLKVIYKIDMGVGTATITNEIIDKVGISVDELRMSAMINAKNSLQKMSMAEVLGLPEVIFADGPAMTIVTNDRKVYGAGVMVNEEALSQIGEKFFILPSSVHELICLPYTDDADIEIMKSMVAEINVKEVDPMDVLSDSVYIYENGKVRVA